MCFTVRIIPFQTATLVSHSFQSILSARIIFGNRKQALLAVLRLATFLVGYIRSNYPFVARNTYGGVRISRDEHF